MLPTHSPSSWTLAASLRIVCCYLNFSAMSLDRWPGCPRHSENNSEDRVRTGLCQCPPRRDPTHLLPPRATASWVTAINQRGSQSNSRICREVCTLPSKCTSVSLRCRGSQTPCPNADRQPPRSPWTSVKEHLPSSILFLWYCKWNGFLNFSHCQCIEIQMIFAC